MIEQETVDDMRVHLAPLLAAVNQGDLKRVYDVYETLHRDYRVDGSHAAAMLLVEELRTERRRFRQILRNANEEAAKYAQGFLDEQKRTAEWKAVVEQQKERIRGLRERLEAQEKAAA